MLATTTHWPLLWHCVWTVSRAWTGWMDGRSIAWPRPPECHAQPFSALTSPRPFQLADAAAGVNDGPGKLHNGKRLRLIDISLSLTAFWIGHKAMSSWIHCDQWPLSLCLSLSLCPAVSLQPTYQLFIVAQQPWFYITFYFLFLLLITYIRFYFRI